MLMALNEALARRIEDDLIKELVAKVKLRARMTTMMADAPGRPSTRCEVAALPALVALDGGVGGPLTQPSV